MQGVTISAHAIERFRERTGCKKSDDQISKRLLRFLERSEEAELSKNYYKIVAIINHHFKVAKYYQFGEWVMVVEGNELKTIHRGEAKRWKKKE